MKEDGSYFLVRIINSRNTIFYIEDKLLRKTSGVEKIIDSFRRELAVILMNNPKWLDFLVQPRCAYYQTVKLLSVDNRVASNILHN